MRKLLRVVTTLTEMSRPGKGRQDVPSLRRQLQGLPRLSDVPVSMER
jgi:hypothetical protein